MLDELHVENLGIIQSATIEPGSGLVAVTGETGAGKTLLLGALRLLRGDPAGADRIGPHDEEARVEGRFLLDGDEVVASRRITPNRSRAYLDGSMVPAKALSERFEGLIEIVAQHEHVTLGREASLRRILDGMLDDTGRDLLDDYGAAWSLLAELEHEASTIGGDERLLARELDLLRHQAVEIEAAGVSSQEDEELAATLRRLRHAGEISESLGAALDGLQDDNRAVDLLRVSLDHTRTASKLDPALDGLAGRIEGLIATAEEILSGLRSALSETEHEPGALAAAETRGAVLADLKRKYGATVDEVLSFGKTAAQTSNEIANALERAESISAEIAAARLVAIDAGRRLAEARRSAANLLSDSARDGLQSLGFSDPALELQVVEAEPGPGGADRISLSFASDRALTPGPVTKVASGGELSRLVLAVRVAAGVADAPIVAFDEVDAGVGGSTALAMGEQLASLASTGQALVVTHLPQVAAFADRHFVVERDGAAATVRQVEGAERLAEIARMLGGMEESERGRLHAEELLDLATERRLA
jgi:DNA repair protein RecN (Recombination protein N)